VFEPPYWRYYFVVSRRRRMSDVTAGIRRTAALLYSRIALVCDIHSTSNRRCDQYQCGGTHGRNVLLCNAATRFRAHMLGIRQSVEYYYRKASVIADPAIPATTPIVIEQGFHGLL